MAEDQKRDVQLYLVFWPVASRRAKGDTGVVLLEKTLEEAMAMAPHLKLDSMASEKGLVVKPISPGTILEANLVIR